MHVCIQPASECPCRSAAAGTECNERDGAAHAAAGPASTSYPDPQTHGPHGPRHSPRQWPGLLQQWTLREWPRIRKGLAWAARVHLALFYLHGVYYRWVRQGCTAVVVLPGEPALQYAPEAQ